MTTIKLHWVTDQWRVEIDGKTYWVSHKRRQGAPDRDSDWTVEAVRPAPGGYVESEWFQLVDQDGRTFRRVVAAMREAIKETV
jgi:hypothetical protein